MGVVELVALVAVAVAVAVVVAVVVAVARWAGAVQGWCGGRVGGRWPGRQRQWPYGSQALGGALQQPRQPSHGDEAPSRSGDPATAFMRQIHIETCDGANISFLALGCPQAPLRVQAARAAVPAYPLPE